jgi:hypothetical protein
MPRRALRLIWTPTTPEELRLVFRFFDGIGGGRDALRVLTQAVAAFLAAPFDLYLARLKFSECSSPARIIRAVKHLDATLYERFVECLIGITLELSGRCRE